MQWEVRFMTLSGKFDHVKTESFPSKDAAVTAVKAYAEAAGYSNIKVLDGDDPYDDGLRFTGKTPGGRSGRNIAFADPVY